MANYKTAFGSFLKTEDLQGRIVPVTIESVGLEQIKGDHGLEQKLVVHFADKEKGMILNMTNCELIAGIAGTEDYEEWVGLRVALYATTTKFGGKTVPCMRIKQVVAAATARATPRRPSPPPEPEPEPDESEPDTAYAPLTDDDIPFAWLLPLVLPALGLIGMMA